MIRRHLLGTAAVVSLLALGACGAMVPVAVGGGGALATALTVANATTTVLSDAAQIACAGQKAANDAGAAATQLGSATAAQDASKISVVLGKACTWL